MKTLSVSDYRTEARELERRREDLLLNQPAANGVAYEQDRAMEKRSRVSLARADMAWKLSMVTGHTFEMVIEGMPSSVMGFYQPGNDGIYVEESLFDDERRGKHVLVHEGVHKDSDIYALDLSSNLSLEQMEAIKSAVGMTGLEDDRVLIEGFTELVTIDKVGRLEEVAYLRHEVPLALKLENLGLELLGVSLAAVFHHGGGPMKFHESLRLLGEALIFRGSMGKVMAEVA